ncbi:MAG TPA: bifunctional 4-hydroxy-2-oxoglutarate aldolase/2-dehydro-3-deoxy-phosphogluconate aldolase [Rectinema sp.]|nr:bifunctional 4-hydroxy-2-oxoglutarate aldolase/2-dehydro-3-deoxy-phosphogluconate aldolase [Rectinema sp.]
MAKKEEIGELFYRNGLIPVIKIDSADTADGLATALRRGGLSVAEITFRTKAAPKVIERFASCYEDILIGAGTVTKKDEVDTAISAGAQFIVSPGFNPSICEYCLGKDVPIFPGVNNPSLIEQAMAMGINILKFFPAEVSGGAKALNAFRSVYQQVSFIPTGGIQENNINEYLSLKNVLACGGSWIVSADLLEAGKFDEIERLVKSARRAMIGFLPIVQEGIDEENQSRSMRDGGCIEVKTPSIKRTLAMLSYFKAYAIPGSEIENKQGLLEVSVGIPGLHAQIHLVE